MYSTTKDKFRRYLSLFKYTLLTTKGLMEADNFANNAGNIAKPVNNKYYHRKNKKDITFFK